MYRLVFPMIPPAHGRRRSLPHVMTGTLARLASHLRRLHADAPHLTAGAAIRRADGSYLGNPTRPARLP
jgi:hypothetical protein